MYGGQCTIYCVYYTMYSVQCTVYCIYYTMYCVYYTIHSIQFLPHTRALSVEYQVCGVFEVDKELTLVLCSFDRVYQWFTLHNTTSELHSTTLPVIYTTQHYKWVTQHNIASDLHYTTLTVIYTTQNYSKLQCSP